MYYAKAFGRRIQFAMTRFGIKLFGDKHCNTLIMKLCQNPELKNQGVVAQELMALPLEEKKQFLLGVFSIANASQPEKIASIETAEQMKAQRNNMAQQQPGNNNTVMTEEEGKKESVGIGNNVIAIEIAMNVLLFIFAHMFWFPLGSIVVLAGRFINKRKEKKEEKSEKQELTENDISGGGGFN